VRLSAPFDFLNYACKLVTQCFDINYVESISPGVRWNISFLALVNY
jgi:hypothetical protein